MKVVNCSAKLSRVGLNTYENYVPVVPSVRRVLNLVVAVKLLPDPDDSFYRDWEKIGRAHV